METTTVSLALKPALADRLIRYMTQAGRGRSEVIRQALDEFLVKQGF